MCSKKKREDNNNLKDFPKTTFTSLHSRESFKRTYVQYKKEEMSLEMEK